MRIVAAWHAFASVVELDATDFHDSSSGAPASRHRRAPRRKTRTTPNCSVRRTLQLSSVYPRLSSVYPRQGHRLGVATALALLGPFPTAELACPEFVGLDDSSNEG